MTVIRRGLVTVAIATSALLAAGVSTATASTSQEVEQPPGDCSVRFAWHVPGACLEQPQHM